MRKDVGDIDSSDPIVTGRVSGLFGSVDNAKAAGLDSGITLFEFSTNNSSNPNDYTWKKLN